jgi:hypothetical protein
VASSPTADIIISRLSGSTSPSVHEQRLRVETCEELGQRLVLTPAGDEDCRVRPGHRVLEVRRELDTRFGQLLREYVHHRIVDADHGTGREQPLDDRHRR